MPPTGDARTASRAFFSSASIWASTAATLARAPAISSARAPALSRATPSVAARVALARSGDSRGRHIAPRRRIVALLAGAGVRLEQRLEALQIHRRGLQLRLGSLHIRLRRFGLGAGLPDIFDARTGGEEPQLREGLIPSDSRGCGGDEQSEFVKKAVDYLDDAAKQDKFSGVVLVARKGTPILQKAYGFADQDKKIPNNMDTKFNLGSINKLFTRLCIDQLVSQGKLSYDDNLGKYLPDYPNHEAAEKVTIRQLLSMRSGIGDFLASATKPLRKKTADAGGLRALVRQPAIAV